MKKAFYKWSSYLIIVSFLVYWILSIAMSVSLSTRENELAKTFPRFNRYFGHTWGLFVQSFDYNDRLYLVLRNRETKTITDSLELMKEMAYKKTEQAPFNQKEYILNRLISHYVTIVKHKAFVYSNQIKKYFPKATDSFYNARLRDAEMNDRLFVESTQTISNYCKEAIAEKNIDTAGKEFQIIIKEKKIKPFDQRKNDKYISNEAVYYQSPFNAFRK